MSASINIEDPEELACYLMEKGYIPRHVTPEFQILPGGVSNRTVLVEFDDASWVLKQALNQLRVAVEWYADPARIQREALGLRWLRQLAPPGSVPDLVFEDPQNHILAMQAVPQPHANWKALLLEGKIDHDLVRQFGRLLGSLHRNAFLRRTELAPLFEDRSFFESLRLEPYYAYTACQVPGAEKFLTELIASTRRINLTLVHGDYSPKNILVYAGRMVLLDHEVIHFGDPAFDLGFSLTHLLSKAHHLPEWRAEFAQSAIIYWQAYLESLGPLDWTDRLEQRVVRHTLGCLLARVTGRSPLEYLSAAEKLRQRQVVVGLMTAPPGTVRALVEGFLEGLPRR